MTSPRFKQNFVSFAVGFLFAIGLSISGMTNPKKVIDFLSPWNWDPGLVFVMIGAILVHATAYRFIRRRPSPLLDSKWYLPKQNIITPSLVIGSALFGIGWGLGGYCPGPGLASLPGGDYRAFLFVGAMLAGIFLFKKTEPFLKLK